MCGICGIVDMHGNIDREVLARMARAIRHRGPNDEGFYVMPDNTAVAVGFGFRRLSIIDLATGNQPISNEDRTVWVVFNGEIYNFRSLRRDLEQRGHQFSTNSDTEVIVHLYEEMGPRLVERLNGMFAIALWDEAQQALMLARDRFGKKPLYYADLGGTLLFASELKSLVEHPRCPAELDLDALSRYLALEYIPAPYSIIQGIHKLPAGHRLRWDRGTVRIERYWKLELSADAPPRPDAEYVDEFRTLLREAVHRRLISDVPLGAFLSGGIDSSSVVAMMAQALPAHAVKTFSIAFGERSFDESGHARRVAEYFGTDHHEAAFTPEVMVDLLPEVTEWLDEPFGDASILPTYLLSRFTREHVTVALGGDGADEFLAGYPTFVAERFARLYRVPRLLHANVILPLVDRLPVSTANFSFDFKLKRFLRGASSDDDVRHAIWLGSFTPDEQARLLSAAARDPFAEQRETFARSSGDAVTRLIDLYATTYLPDDILVKVDRASMACSLEVRAPFLDVDLVEFLGRVPSRLKLHGLQTKHLLKRAMADILPPGIAARPKKGFGIPIGAWFKQELRDALQDELSPERISKQGLFNSLEVQRLVSEHLSGRRDHRKALWTLFVFQLWHRRWIERRETSGSRETRVLSA